MSEENPNPPDSSPGTGPNPVDEAEVERIINEATNLSNEIGDQVGASDQLPGDDSSIPSLDEPLAEQDIIEQLDEVESMLKEVGMAEESLPPESQDAISPASPEPAPPAQVEKGSDEKSTEKDERPVDPESAPQGSPGENPTSRSDGDLLPPESEAAASDEAHDAGETSPPAPIANVFSRWRDQISKALSQIPDLFFATLDSIDELFVWVGYPVRRVLGWLSLGMFIASCAITASSLS